jgi:coenzyme F420-reducing hydrogenase delta subunit/ferredoxin
LKQHVNPIKALYLYLEAWFSAAFGDKWNPFYHLGSLAFFFFWIVLVSGIYLLIFFKTTLSEAYSSLEYLTHEQWYIGGLMRSFHRYASDAAVLTIMLHVFREFALDRYRGFRWYSWFTGIPTLWMVVLLGITGYWMVWDQLAQYVAVGSAKLLGALPFFNDAMSRNFLEGNISERFFTLMGFLHLLGQPMFLIFMVWFHVRRLAHVEVTVPRGLAVGVLLSLTVLSLIKPALSHAPADLSIVPTELHLDWFYLNIFPLLDKWDGMSIWYLSVGATILLMMMPWLPPKKTGAAAVVDLDHCNGCAQCAEDCPFDAITMQKRTDGKEKYDQEPVVLDHLCASCGICVGSCVSSNPFRRADKELQTGIDMPQYKIHEVRTQIQAVLAGMAAGNKILVFNCRNAFNVEEFASPDIGVVKLFCIGQLPASMVDYALKNGAAGVLIMSCRPGDCYYRLGNIWLDERLQGTRKPLLRSGVDRDKMLFFGSSEVDGRKVKNRLEKMRQAVLRHAQQEVQS